MAGKARRAASRQGQLKRKKTVKGPSGIPSSNQMVVDSEGQEPVSVSAGVENAAIEATETTGTTSNTGSDAPVTPRAPRPSPVARTPRGEFTGQSQARLRGERPAAYLYVGSEVRRILILTGVILAALIALGIVL
ncbi:MAG: hypothetical protein HQ475_09510 [SAR202 cluster bacterium]|nr:hypothetical protein [SAR202 cluster bacterium]